MEKRFWESSRDGRVYTSSSVNSVQTYTRAPRVHPRRSAALAQMVRSSGSISGVQTPLPRPRPEPLDTQTPSYQSRLHRKPKTGNATNTVRIGGPWCAYQHHPTKKTKRPVCNDSTQWVEAREAMERNGSRSLSSSLYISPIHRTRFPTVSDVRVLVHPPFQPATETKKPTKMECPPPTNIAPHTSATSRQAGNPERPGPRLIYIYTLRPTPGPHAARIPTPYPSLTRWRARLSQRAAGHVSLQRTRGGYPSPAWESA